MPVSFLEFLGRRLLAGPGRDGLGRARDAVVRVEHVHRDTNRAALVGECAADRVPDPPRRVRAEAVTAVVVEALDGLHQADVALLDEVDERAAGRGCSGGQSTPRDAGRRDEAVSFARCCAFLRAAHVLQVPLERGRHADVVTDDVTLVWRSRRRGGAPRGPTPGRTDGRCRSSRILVESCRQMIVPARFPVALPSFLGLRALAELAERRELGERLVLDARLDDGATLSKHDGS